MNEELEVLYDLYGMTMAKLRNMREKFRNHGGEIPSGDVDCFDKLNHSLKSLKTTIAMIESENNSGEYSNRYYGPYYSRNEGQSNRGYSYTKQNSMGRYSRTDGVHDMINGLSEDKLMKVQQYIENMERM